MPTVTYTFVDRCAGGGHTRFDITINGGASRRVTFQTDELRVPLSGLSVDDREQLAMLVLKVRMAGKTRAQIVTELGSPVVVTI